MTQLPAKRSESVFEDFKKAYTPKQKRSQRPTVACTVMMRHASPLAQPPSISPHLFGGLRTIMSKGQPRPFDSNILGMSCARFAPLKPFVWVTVFTTTWRPRPFKSENCNATLRMLPLKIIGGTTKRVSTGKKVVCVGGGPASLAAAHELRLLGHDVTILEKGHFLGGLNTTGVAPYKMKSDRSLNEVEWILSIGGINIESGVSVPENKSWADLQNEYDAIFVGFGLGPDSMMGLPGANAQGIHGAVDYIARFKLCEEDLSNVSRAVVVGGGNTALDAVRELKVWALST